MRLRSHGWIALLALTAGCASPVPGHPAGQPPSAAESAAMARRAGLTPAEIEQAVAVYNLKCARCHKFYNPADYDNAEWKLWMTRMSRKARLKPEQEKLLARYLAALRQGSPSP